MNNLEKAKQELDDALINVARCAQELAHNASMFTNGDYKVNSEDMKELKEYISLWNKASNNFLVETGKVEG